MSLQARFKTYLPISALILGGLVLAVVIRNELAHRVFIGAFVSFYLVWGGFSTVGLVQVTQSVAKGHYINRNYGLSLMLTGVGFLLTNWDSLFKVVDWIQRLITLVIGSSLIIVSSWSIIKTSRDLRDCQVQTR